MGERLVPQLAIADGTGTTNWRPSVGWLVLCRHVIRITVGVVARARGGARMPTVVLGLFSPVHRSES